MTAMVRKSAIPISKLVEPATARHVTQPAQVPSSSSTARNEESSPMSPSSRQRRSMPLTLSMRKPNHWYSPGASGSHNSRTRWVRSCSSIGLRRTWSPTAQVLLTKRHETPGRQRQAAYRLPALVRLRRPSGLGPLASRASPGVVEPPRPSGRWWPDSRTSGSSWCRRGAGIGRLAGGGAPGVVRGGQQGL